MYIYTYKGFRFGVSGLGFNLRGLQRLGSWVRAFGFKVLGFKERGLRSVLGVNSGEHVVAIAVLIMARSL